MDPNIFFCGHIFSPLSMQAWLFFRDRIWVIGGQRSLNDAWASTDFSATSWMQLVPNAPFGRAVGPRCVSV